jgi:hypothetical protein
MRNEQLSLYWPQAESEWINEAVSSGLKILHIDCAHARVIRFCGEYARCSSTVTIFVSTLASICEAASRSYISNSVQNIQCFEIMLFIEQMLVLNDL